MSIVRLPGEHRYAASMDQGALFVSVTASTFAFSTAICFSLRENSSHLAPRLSPVMYV